MRTTGPGFLTEEILDSVLAQISVSEYSSWYMSITRRRRNIYM